MSKSTLRELITVLTALLEALAKQETPPPRLPPALPTHRPSFVLRDGAPTLCCDEHFQPDPVATARLQGPQGSYITDRLGGRLGLGPRR